MIIKFIQDYLTSNSILDFSKFSLRDDGQGIFFDKWEYDIAQPTLPTKLEIALDALKEKIKAEAGFRIYAVYPDYKQRNLNGAVSLVQNKELLALKAGSGNYTPTEEEMVLLRAAKACKDFIDAIRAKSNELEASLDSMTEEQLNAFNPSEDSNWE